MNKLSTLFRHPLLLPAIAALLALGAAQAADTLAAQHKVVLQATTADAGTHDLILIIANGLQQKYGMDALDLEIVAYGEGVKMLEAANPLAARVKSLAMRNVRFSACNNTLRFIEKQTGKKPALSEGVQVVDDGVVRLIELQEQGYAYLYPK